MNKTQYLVIGLCKWSLILYECFKIFEEENKFMQAHARLFSNQLFAEGRKFKLIL